MVAMCKGAEILRDKKDYEPFPIRNLIEIQ